MEAERLTATSLVESVWLDRSKYEESETRFQEVIAQQHAQLEVVGKGVGGDRVNEIAELIGQTQSMIQEKLRSTASKTPSTVVALEQRVAKLERSNEELEKRVAALEKLLKSQGSGAEPPKQQQQSKDDEEEDDFDLFGSDDEDDEEVERLKQERLAKYQEKKAAKPAVIAKSSIVLEVKPWDDETDLNEMEKCVRSVEADGLAWRASKFVPVGYGINKLQINCIIEDDKIGTDFLEEEITKFEDLVQSVDIAAFNKI